MKRAILLVLQLTSGVAVASEWAVVTAYENGASLLVDVSGVHITGDIRRAWSKYIFAPHTDKGVGPGYANKWITFSLTSFAFDCGKGSYRIEAMELHYEDDTVLTETPDDLSKEMWAPVPPDSRFDPVMKLVCTLPAGKPK